MEQKEKNAWENNDSMDLHKLLEPFASLKILLFMQFYTFFIKQTIN